MHIIFIRSQFRFLTSNEKLSSNLIFKIRITSPEIYPLSLHDALPIYQQVVAGLQRHRAQRIGDDADLLLVGVIADPLRTIDRKSTRLNSSHTVNSYDDFCLKKKTDLTKDLQQKQVVASKEASEKNRKAGEEFLAANKSKERVMALPDGLQYKILTPGNGPKPTASDTVVCNYKGTLIDGNEFDSSYKRGQPATFPVSGVIKGWTEALQMMPVGSKWQLFIPPDLAYGDRQAGPDITPGSTLVFEVELMSIQPKTAAAPDAGDQPKASDQG